MAEPKPIEWKDGRDHREPKWPLRGYAPGGYISVCRACEQSFVNMDKRAYHCLPCAIEEAEFLIANYSGRLREMEAENTTLKAAIKLVSPHDAIRTGVSKERA